jgi:hypothetical protein
MDRVRWRMTDLGARSTQLLRGGGRTEHHPIRRRRHKIDHTSIDLVGEPGDELIRAPGRRTPPVVRDVT